MDWRTRYLRACSSFLWAEHRCDKRELGRAKRRIRALLREAGALG